MYVQATMPDSAPPAQSAKKQQVTQDQFLQLLITQLQHQDPLQPQDDSTMLAQLAQFNALDQMKALSQGSAQQQALAMLGRVVAASDAGGNPVTGQVLAVLLSSSGAQLKLPGNVTVDAGSVTEVTPLP